MSSKRTYDGNEIVPAGNSSNSSRNLDLLSMLQKRKTNVFFLTDVRHEMTLVELRDMRKEYELVLARLRLIKRDPDPAIVTGMERFNYSRLNLHWYAFATFIFCYRPCLHS